MFNEFHRFAWIWFSVIGIAVAIQLAREIVNKDRIQIRDTLTNVLTFVMSFGFILLLRPVLGLWVIASGIYSWVPWHIPVTPLTCVLSFIVVDLHFYWSHRLNHRSRILWVLHQVHHSSSYFNLSVLMRRSFLTGLFLDFRVLTLALIGFHPMQVISSYVFLMLYLGSIHIGEIGKIRWLDPVLNTPSNHRVHHGLLSNYINKNYAAGLIIWDRLFGTYEKETASSEFGINEKPENNHPILIQTTPFFQMLRELHKLNGLGQKLIWIFGPPEYEIINGQIAAPQIQNPKSESIRDAV